MILIESSYLKMEKRLYIKNETAYEQRILEVLMPNTEAMKLIELRMFLMDKEKYTLLEIENYIHNLVENRINRKASISEIVYCP